MKELYYAIMNVADHLALNGADENREKLFAILDELARISEMDISDIADANNCGNCETWADVVDALKEQFETGERF